MKIIDSHIHFWNPGLLHYEWIQGEPLLNRAFLPSDFRAVTEGLDVSGLVFVQADCRAEQGLDEVKWVSQLADEIPIRAIVAFAPLEQGSAVRPMLDALKAYPLVKGVRRLIQSEGAGFAAQPIFMEGVKALADYGYSFDICIRHHQLADVVKLVSNCPDMSFVLDHIGKPAVAARDIEAWGSNLQELAQHENVCCKLSGMVTEANHATWTISDLRPYAHTVLNAFGSRRVMFGSDWPVCTMASSYRKWVNTAQHLISYLSMDDQQRIFVDNAQDFYRL